jgi:putative spermidine/putrescine transport system ATP-binding protein
MDEPLSNLDAKLRLEMRTEIRRLHQTLGLTTIYVTHDQEEALSLSDRLVLMRDGAIRQVGPPKEVYAEPSSAYAAGFLGYRNLLRVEVLAAEEDGARIATESRVELSGRARDRLSAGDEAVAAIRPEDVSVFPHDHKEPGSVAGRVELVEFLGRDSELNIRSDLGDVVARTDGDWRPGDDVRVLLPHERLLVFAQEDR